MKVFVKNEKDILNLQSGCVKPWPRLNKRIFWLFWEIRVSLGFWRQAYYPALI